ncbi:MAG TPA: hypothetical protein VIP57_15420 [Candidatus Dormibacteraeota bacterium]
MRTRPLVTTVLILVATVGLTAVAPVERVGAATPESAEPGLAGVFEPALSAEAAERQAGIVDLATGNGEAVFGALEGLGGRGYFGAVALADGEVPITSFGDEGYTRLFHLPFSGFNVEPQAEAVAVQPDGKVVVAGYSQDGIRRPDSFAALLARYSPDGSLDQSFGTAGIVGERPESPGGTQLHDLAVTPDGTILAVGGRNENERGVGAPAGVLLAYRSDGSLDTVFGKGGRVTVKGRAAFYSTLRAVDVLASGKILLLGYLNHRVLLVQLDPDGSPDRSFGGGDGKVTLDVHTNFCCEPDALALAPGGRIIVAAVGGNYRRPRTFLARYLPSGRLDRSFGKDGVEAPFLRRRLGVLLGVAVAPEGKIVTVGRTEAKDANHRGSFALFRSLPDGRPDRGFGREGLYSLKLGPEGIAGAALTLPSGILIGGSFIQGSTTSLLLAKLG